MAELVTFARPYAKAAFEYADAVGQFPAIKQWGSALDVMAQIASQESVQALLKSPTLTAIEKSAKLIELADISDEKLCNFVRALGSNQRLLLLTEICQIFNQLKLKREQQVDVYVQSAFDVTDNDKSKLNDALGRHFGSDIQIQSEIDANLIGGVIIHANGSMIDASIKGRLVKFAESTSS